MQDSLPPHQLSLAPEWPRPLDEERTQELLHKSELRYDQHAHSISWHLESMWLFRTLSPMLGMCME